jgi:hypothetical protein
MSGEITPYLEPGRHPTAKPNADVLGGRAVMVDSAATEQFSTGGLRSTAGTGAVPVKPCTAGAKMLGVAQCDQTAASGKLVMVYREGWVPAIAGAAITAGVEVEVGTAGKFIPLNTGIAVGLAISGAGADTNTFVLAPYS